ncbi:MAG: phospho-N-acetylmuramoyl-pentapeptide-transferase [Candidatus Lambdaproteobacteria bacterium]|nr:phospho-N-acetylmuramoyl-pentapeptide-transferase [Candidatus Lambdaproteobacteria bacterium]
MLGDLLYAAWPYQIFKSVFFRSGMAFLFTYWVIVFLMPPTIRYFRRAGVTSDFVPAPQRALPYAGGKPIMGGWVLIVAVLVGAVLWVKLNQFIVALVLIMVAFGVIGGIDDVFKIRHRMRVQRGDEAQKSYADKADGISGRVRLLLEFLVAALVVVGLYRYVQIDGHMVVPFVPLSWFYPYLPKYLFVPFMVLIIVAGANAVNLTDGMDSLATVPILTCTLFVAAVAYVGSDPDLAARLKVPQLSGELKELVVYAAAFVSAGLAFLRFNAPPAMITMGDLGALALGSTFSAMFIFAKVELFLPLVGGAFVLTTLSTIIQRAFFKLAAALKGREFAQRVRFFYKAPYHHHLQSLWTYSEQPPQVVSVWANLLEHVGIRKPGIEDQLARTEDVNSRVVWRLHMVSIWLFVLALVVYFKVR